MHRVDRDAASLPAIVPELAAGVMLVMRPTSHSRGQLHAETKHGPTSILGLRSSLGGRRHDTRRTMRDGRRGITTISILTTRTGRQTEFDIALLQEVFLF